ncbi:MAG: decaprenyl-phosphate phosphoribosyltransferase [Acidimicrobiales bacterium]
MSIEPLPSSLAPVPEPTPAVASAPLKPRRRNLPRAILRTARPQQWVKNLLVVAAPGAAGMLGNPLVLRQTIVAVAAFCLAASGTYALNDLLDVKADRLHPAKRYRPVASGELPEAGAIIMAAVLMGGALALSVTLARPQLAIVLGVYVAITTSYSIWLKHEPVIDMAAVASGFVLRAIAGGVATGVPLSDWFLIVSAFGSLFVVSGRRFAEHLEAGEARGERRRALTGYTIDFLRYVRTLSSAVTVTAYCLWAFEKAAKAGHAQVLFELSIIPFTLAILTWARLVELGEGEQPEELLMSSRALQLLVAAWAVLFGLGVYLR